ncbi:putative coiled-coil protein SlyX [Streptacidiphilus sp. MAP12-20]|uniref:DUF4349 domain-containing protein n=1 Tax=Streptacidiphilus sp. MAP12-20 TaxID=3156299 RepID=UPI0035110BD8
MKATSGRRRFGVGLATGVLAAGLALAGCSASTNGAGSSAGGGAAARNPVAAPQAGGAAQAAGGGAASTTDGKTGASKPLVAGHSVIYSGELQLQCDHVDATLKEAEDLVAAAGGFVDSEQSGNNGAFPNGGYTNPQGQAQTPPPLPVPTQIGGDSAQAVFKVPTSSYDAVYQELIGLGAVLGRERASQDVTAQVVDLGSRIKTQQASIDRVNALMKQAGSLNDIVALESALTQRESDLESMQSQLAALQNQVAMSTVTVELFQKATPPAPVAAPKPRGAWSAAGHALAAGWHALYEVGRALLVALAAMLPFLVLLALIGGAIYFFLRRRTAPKPTETDEP